MEINVYQAVQVKANCIFLFRMQDAFADHHHHEQRVFMEERLACCKIFIHCMRSNYASVAESFILRNSLL